MRCNGVALLEQVNWLFVVHLMGLEEIMANHISPYPQLLMSLRCWCSPSNYHMVSGRCRWGPALHGLS